MKPFFSSIGLALIITSSSNLFAATTVTLDFQSAALGSFTSATPLQVADGIGGTWTLTPSTTPGTTYSIIDKGGDRELRLTDIGSTAGSFVIDITHSSGAFTQLSGGTYEATIGLNIGNFTYQNGSYLIFSDSNPISTAIDSPITFGAQTPTNFARFTGNGIFSSGSNVQIDIDELVFSVSSTIPEPCSSSLLCFSGILLIARRTRSAS
ncbi:hypothetical protein ACFPK9_12135 [Rubritalea spongiae]|uniref:PEP-CTERM sorting domain-containing protein n=1 Tax=Rubritalea spongiae TaxID=430797 RepID=A0ABW5DZS8_9BACT